MDAKKSSSRISVDMRAVYSSARSCLIGSPVRDSTLLIHSTASDSAAENSSRCLRPSAASPPASRRPCLFEPTMRSSSPAYSRSILAYMRSARPAFPAMSWHSAEYMQVWNSMPAGTSPRSTRPSRASAAPSYSSAAPTTSLPETAPIMSRSAFPYGSDRVASGVIRAALRLQPPSRRAGRRRRQETP